MNVKVRMGRAPSDDLEIVFLRRKKWNKRRRSLKDDFTVELFEFRKISIELDYIAKSLLRVDQNCFASNVGVAQPEFL